MRITCSESLSFRGPYCETLVRPESGRLLNVLMYSDCRAISLKLPREQFPAPRLRLVSWIWACSNREQPDRMKNSPVRSQRMIRILAIACVLAALAMPAVAADPPIIINMPSASKAPAAAPAAPQNQAKPADQLPK